MKIKRVSVLLICICIVVALCSCKSSSKLCGNWVCDEVHSSYPDQMIMNEDGTGTMDGVSCSWSANDDTITFVAGIYGSYSYKYSIKGYTLYLDEYSYTKQ